MKNFSIITEPLYKLKYKNELFVWTDQYQPFFDEFKYHVGSMPMLEICDGNADT